MRLIRRTRAVACSIIGCGAVGLAAALVAPTPSAGADTGERELATSFSGVSGTLRGGETFATRGSSGLDGVLQVENGAAARATTGPWGGSAIDLPDFRAGALPSTVPIAIVTFGGSDQSARALNPGTAPFSFGASFKLSETSGTSDVDNGENLIQRGLWGSRSQYKIDLDHGRPNCLVRGADGAVMVTGDVKVPTDTWFAIRCTRDDRGVTLTVRGTGSGASSFDREWRENGATGSLGGLDDAVPLSVGGKINDDGSPVVGASDQFNGSVDNVVVDIDR